MHVLSRNEASLLLACGWRGSGRQGLPGDGLQAAAWSWIPALPVPGCVISVKLTVPQFPQVQDGDENSNYLRGFL